MTGRFFTPSFFIMNFPDSVPARHWHAVDDGRLQCDVCPRFCKLHDGQRGLCFVRARDGDELVLTTWGRSSGFCIDPIEKKPLNHFLPGTPILSFGTAGCNLTCKFCQNWDISKSREVDRLNQVALPETIAKAAQRGGHMVKSLLSLARQTPTEEAVLDLNILLREEVQLLARTTLSRIQLRLELAEDLWPILGDASALTSAFMNLCVNAVDAMPEGGTLAISSRNLEPGQVEVTVEDSGSGMPKEVLAKALDPFFTTKEVGKGTGLGLSIVYSTVKSHQGQMQLRSEPGQGTRISLRFPACHAAAPLPAQPESGAEPTTRRPLRVLLVDDDELVQSSVQLMLQALGHEVAVSTSGEEALGWLEDCAAPDLVILDLNMPGLSGANTLVRLRAQHPELPVLLSTGRADQVALDLAEAHPHVSLLPKPFTMKVLRQQLGQFQVG